MKNWTNCMVVWAALLMGLPCVVSAEDLEFSRNSTQVLITGTFDQDGGPGEWFAELQTFTFDGSGGEAYVGTTAMVNLGGEVSSGGSSSSHNVNVQATAPEYYPLGGQPYAENDVFYNVSDTVVSPTQNPSTAVPVKIYFEADWSDGQIIINDGGTWWFTPEPNRSIYLDLWVDSTMMTVVANNSSAVSAYITDPSGYYAINGTDPINGMSGSFDAGVVHYSAHHGDDAGFYGNCIDGLGLNWGLGPGRTLDAVYSGMFSVSFDLELLNEE